MIVMTINNQPREPYPGAPTAVDQGCLCPPIENNNGLGRTVPKIIRGEVKPTKDGWWVNDTCPLHGLGK